MSTEGRRAIMATVRRVVFTGLIILGAWLLLTSLRGAIPDSAIDAINSSERHEGFFSYDSATWDWTRSFWTGKTVSQLIGLRLGFTLKHIGLEGLLSLAIAAVLLSIGFLISRLTERRRRLARLRSILRLVLVSAGASAPVFVVSTFFIVFIVGRNWSLPKDLAAVMFWSGFFAPLLPAWLLVQAGHGELTSTPESTPLLRMIPRLSISLIIRLLRLVGVIIVVTLSVEKVVSRPGLGRLLIESLNRLDFPVVFGIVWVFVIIVALTKLAADLIEIASNHFGRQVELTEPVTAQPLQRQGVPKGWLVFALVMVVVSIVVAIVGPLLAPDGYNQIVLGDRLAAPSTEHPLGVDNLGRDVLSRLLYGIRIDVFAGLTFAGVLTVVAAGWAMLAEYLRRLNNWACDFLESLVTLPAQIIGVFPWLALLLLLMSMVSDKGGFFSPVVSLVSSLVLLPRAVSMIQEAYRSLPGGKGLFQSMLRAIPVVFIFTVAGGMLYVSNLSYLGWGVPPPFPELGSMLSGPGGRYMLQAPWMVLWPALSLVFLLMAWVIAGDALLERFGFRSKAVWSKIME